VLILGLASMLNAASISLFGTVTDLAGHPLFGAAVQFGNRVTGTDSSGAWSISDLEGTARIAERFRAPVPISSNLVLSSSHLQLRLGSSNVLGRILSRPAAQSIPAPNAAPRYATAGSTDSLWIAWNGRIRARFGGASLAHASAGTVSIDTAFTPGEQSCPGAIACGTLTDSRDGQVYRTVTIGTQTWMAQNMTYSMSPAQAVCRDTSAGPYGDWAYARSWCNDSTPGVGRFYTLLTRDGPADPCPAGWHIPSPDDWDVLVASVGGPTVAARMLKSRDGWEPSGNGLDVGGFDVLPVGYGDGWEPTTAAYFLATVGQSARAVFWTSSSSADSSQVAFRSDLASMDRTDWRVPGHQGLAYGHGFSVRCLMN
jgi:uncharacterized protein (TIGR02145 family)